MVSSANTRRSIRRDLRSGFAVLLFTVGIVAGSIHYYVSIREAEASFEVDNDARRNSVAQLLAMHLWNFDVQAIELICNTMLESREILGVRVVDQKDRVVFHKGALADSSGPRTINQLDHDGTIIGRFEIAFSEDLLRARKKDVIRTTVIVVIASLVAFLLIGDPLLTRLIVRPLEGLERSIEAFSKGLVDVPAPSGREDEIHRAINAFGDLTRKLTEQELALRASHAQLERRVQERTAELEVANKELESFSYSISHDLRAPLRHLTGFSDLLLQDPAAVSLDDRCQGYLKDISEAAQQMGQLIDDLLEFSRMTRSEVTTRPVNVNELVSEAIRKLESYTSGREIDWRIGELPEVEADPSMLMSVFVNLLSNAIKFSAPREKAKIEIGHSVENGENTFFVRDNGVGFQMDYVDKIFGVFQRLHRDEDFEGTGIGLALVQRIIHRHGGQVWAEAVVDHGATVFFNLPGTSPEGIARRVSHG